MSFSIIYQCRPYSLIDMIKKLKFCPEDDQIIALLKVYWSTNNNQLFVSKAARFYTCKSHQRWNSFQSTLHYFWKKKTISSTQLLHLNTHQNIDMLYLNLQGMWRFHANSSVFYSKRVMSDVMVLSYNGRGS